MFFLVSNKPEDNVLINISSEIISTGLRKLFSVISKEQLYKEVHLITGILVYDMKLYGSMVWYCVVWCGILYGLDYWSCGGVVDWCDIEY